MIKLSQKLSVTVAAYLVVRRPRPTVTVAESVNLGGTVTRRGPRPGPGPVGYRDGHGPWQSRGRARPSLPVGL